MTGGTVITVLGMIFTALYTWAVYNDLTSRRERLKGLLATARGTRVRRYGVHRDLSQGVRWATRHEQRIAGVGARRGGRGGRLIGDIANGWPFTTAVGSANQGMTIAVQSRDLENRAWQQLQREAEAYNTAIRRFPTCLVAQAFGFHPWSFGKRRRGRPR